MSRVFSVDSFVDYNNDVQVLSLQCRDLVKVCLYKSKYSLWIITTNKSLHKCINAPHLMKCCQTTEQCVGWFIYWQKHGKQMYTVAFGGGSSFCSNTLNSEWELPRDERTKNILFGMHFSIILKSQLRRHQHLNMCKESWEQSVQQLPFNILYSKGPFEMASFEHHG